MDVPIGDRSGVRPSMAGAPGHVVGHPVAGKPVEHVPLRPLWLCRRCGQPWPCGAAKLTLLAEYQGSTVSLFFYLAGCLHDAIDDLHRLNPSETGSVGDMFDRFLGWPDRHTRS